MQRNGLVTMLLAGLGAGGGLVVAVIVTLNLHIFAGPEDGYMSSPADVLEHSVALAVLDVVLLIALPAVVAVAVVRLRGGPRKSS